MSMSDTHHSALSPGLSAQPAGGPVAGQDPGLCLCLIHTTLPHPQVSQHNLLAGPVAGQDPRLDGEEQQQQWSGRRRQRRGRLSGRGSLLQLRPLSPGRSLLHRRPVSAARRPRHRQCGPVAQTRLLPHRAGHRAQVGAPRRRLQTGQSDTAGRPGRAGWSAAGSPRRWSPSTSGSTSAAPSDRSVRHGGTAAG